MFSIISCHSLGESYPFAEVQSVYTATPEDLAYNEPESKRQSME